MEKSYLDFFKLPKDKQVKIGPLSLVQHLIQLFLNDRELKINNNLKTDADNSKIFPTVSLSKSTNPVIVRFNNKLLVPDTIYSDSGNRNLVYNVYIP